MGALGSRTPSGAHLFPFYSSGSDPWVAWPVRRSRHAGWAIADGEEAIELPVRRKDAERFLEDVPADDEELAASLRLEPIELEL